ncbi:unnamed protein product [Clonostachys solani]|uniref:Uncharacterized protein n=1 Tax=Clonostachys solani TaxID=160281 RepID=A0A9N9Z753_9HYPO|nr:unnamed protein product [Clonostachys solani]
MDRPGYIKLFIATTDSNPKSTSQLTNIIVIPMEEPIITIQLTHWLETLHTLLTPMNELLNHLPLAADWLGASGLYLPPIEEFLNHQHHSAASAILAAILLSLALAQVACWLETSGVYRSYDESLFKGTTTLLRAIYALFSWSTLEGLFPSHQTDRERERRLLDNCAGNDLLPPRRSNSTCRRVDSPRRRLTRFKDQWKDKSFPGGSRPAWLREQRIAWERNVCGLYMESMVRDHDALEAQLAERDASLERLGEQMAELELRVEQNRNWYCKIWNMHKPGDVVRRAPMSMAKTALRQTDMWEAMYRLNLTRLEDEAQMLELQLEKMTDGERTLKMKMAHFAQEREEFRKEREKDQALIGELRRELADSLRRMQVEGQDEKQAEDVRTEENPEEEEEDERQIALLAGRMKRRTSKESLKLGSMQLSEELMGADINDDDMLLSWN